MHWAFIAVFACGVTNQVDEAEELEDFALLMNEVLFTVLFLSILLVREVFFWVSVNLMAAHIAGAIYHRFKGDGEWDAMVPFFKERA
ncbi:MAG: hypothetical protein VX095_01220 [Pseudomonadota bacterium]|nr:hypothetical protein [Pseudomonadota bacterium]